MNLSRSKIYLALAVILSATVLARAQEGREPPLITVTGEAEVLVVPDEVIISLGVETSQRDLGAAKSENDARVKRVLALTREFSIDPKHVQTDYITVEPWYRRGTDVPQSLEYRVRKSIVVTLKDTAKFETFLSRVLEVGVTNVQGVQFRTTELRKYRDQARAMAIKAAREKATALAGELGQKIGRAYRISESGGGWYPPYGFSSYYGYGRGMMQNVSQEAGGGAASTDGAVALGQIRVTASVSVGFLLE
ncbi:MAG: SIMPL domain-containing protein [Acidobacteriota bacterium]|nr:SIMPL domain-containing protein [Acidobacteriota bacterium]